MARPRKKKDDTAWQQPATPPPPLFTGEKERNLVKQVNDELIERVIGQQVLYYSIDVERSNYHPLYGEAINKTFLPPVRVYALVKFDGIKTTAEDSFGLDKSTKLEIHFHKRRLIEDQDLYVREGDFVMYGDTFYEIVGLQEPKQLFGQIENRFEVMANCIRARQSLFEAPIINSKTERKFTTPVRQTTSTSTGSNSGYNPTSTGLFTNVIAENNLTVRNNTYLGDSPSDTVLITGSVNVSGSIYINGVQVQAPPQAYSVVFSTVLITSSYSISSTDYYIGVNTNYSGITVTLPSLSSVINGRTFIVKDEIGLADQPGKSIIVSASVGNLIDGDPAVIINADHGGINVYKTATGWHLF